MCQPPPKACFYPEISHSLKETPKKEKERAPLNKGGNVSSMCPWNRPFWVSFWELVPLVGCISRENHRKTVFFPGATSPKKQLAGSFSKGKPKTDLRLVAQCPPVPIHVPAWASAGRRRRRARSSGPEASRWKGSARRSELNWSVGPCHLPARAKSGWGYHLFC